MIELIKTILHLRKLYFKGGFTKIGEDKDTLYLIGIIAKSTLGFERKIIKAYKYGYVYDGEFIPFEEVKTFEDLSDCVEIF